VPGLRSGAWVARTTDAAGVTGTPTVQVDGRTLPDFQPQTLAAAVTAAKA
jgi:protein-disulfide isomerase